MPWVCSTGSSVLDPDGGGYICVDENGQMIPDVFPTYQSELPAEVDGNKTIRPTPMVQLGRARELGVTDTFDRSDSTVKTSVEYAQGLPNRIRADAGGAFGREYQDLEKGLRGYFGQSFESYTSIDAAWNRVVEDAQAGNRAAMDLLAGGKTAFNMGFGQDADGGGRGSGGPSVRYSIDNANEEDIYTLAQGLAMEMIGRPISEKQFDKLLTRVRKEENDSPTITRTSGNRTTTEAGITAEERKSVMAELLQENPGWRQHQMSQGVLDALTRNIQEAKRLDSGV